MRALVQQSQFKTDLKRVAKSGRYKLSDILSVIEDLANDKPLPDKYRDHSLTGNWSDCRDCHIKPDLVLIYRKISNDTLQLIRLGSHSELGL
ncbi:type II toxin-antitoxin system YafQ family toxin [Desulforegula conservatrix]|uniref:type II toxin-antitoxin system YafQ family toxin n=1 Tax=Desulforegula conservatrix TaxID=153026 RepID=UPI00041409DE|nr:type II toxin-antitoxin system YafQ family toxin [Desulforegula conservatrix]